MILIYSTTQQIVFRIINYFSSFHIIRIVFRIINYFSSFHIIRIQWTSGASLETEILSVTFMPFLFIHSFTISY